MTRARAHQLSSKCRLAFKPGPHAHRDPASRVGHAGAGVFCGDARLLVTPMPTSKSTLSLQRKILRIERPTHLSEHRGWFPPHRTSAMEKRGSYSTGGLLSSNVTERSSVGRRR
ncbi:hypothetical protein EV363DRAFT_1149588 [Boletus edulis]|nr:hypothetical protein EV363DRAFT_1149588 [Boletus edulis]